MITVQNLLKNKWLCAFLFIAIALLVYSNSFKAGFVSDDTGYIAGNPSIRNIENIPKVFSAQYFEVSREFSYRPIATLSYFLYYFLADLNPSLYRLFNVLLHAFCGIMVFRLAGLLFPDTIIPFLAGLLFIVHPAHTEAVLVISYNEDILVSVFLLLSLYCYIRNAGYFRKAASLVFYFLALFSKEVAVVFPLILLAFNMCYAPEKDRKPFGRQLASLSGYFSITFFYLFIRFFVLTHHGRSVAGYAGGGFLTNILTMSKVFIGYLRLLVLPVNLHTDYYFKTSETFLEPGVLMAFMLLFIMVVVIMKALKRNKTVSFCVFWIMVTLLPVLNIIPFLNWSLLAERYLYLPSVAFCLLLAALVNSLSALSAGRKKMPLIIGIIIVLFYSYHTLARNVDYGSDIALLQKTLKYNDNSHVAHNDMGVKLSSRGKHEEAEAHLKKAIEVNPDDPNTYNNLGSLYSNLGRYEEARRMYMKSLGIKSHSHKTYNNLGVMYYRQGKYKEAEEMYGKVLKTVPNDLTALNNLGSLYIVQKKYKKAEEVFRKAIKASPRWGGGHRGLGICYYNQGKLRGAENELSMALDINPGYDESRRLLEDMAKQKNRGTGK